MIDPVNEKQLAERMGARRIVTLSASHASLASMPVEVSALIDEAAKATSTCNLHATQDPRGAAAILPGRGPIRLSRNLPFYPGVSIEFRLLEKQPRQLLHERQRLARLKSQMDAQ